MRTKSLPVFETPWTAAYQASLSMGFSRQETGVLWQALLQGIFYLSLALAGGFFAPPGKPNELVLLFSH